MSSPAAGSSLDISEARLMAHIAEFDRWEKHAGSEGERASLEYIRERMDEYGFSTRLILHPAYISLPGPASLEVGGRSIRCITHSFSRPSPAGGLEAAVVYVGRGLPRDYAGKDVRGKVVLVDGIANPLASLAASRAGAAGQIHISPHEHLHEMCISPVWGSPGDDQVAQLPATVVVTVAAESGEELKSALASGEPVAVRIDAAVETGWRTTPILEADLLRPGAAGDEPLVLFTGHHDTWYRGVMDNGGANATMLEVSRLCAERRAEWKRSLRVLYWSGHSQGRYSSSAWYADNHWEELERRAVAHVNVDSTGGRGNTVVSDTTASAELAGLAREALEAQAGQSFSGRRMSRAGDQSFWGIGVPSIYGNMSEQPATAGGANAMAAVFGGGSRIGHGTGWWWHTPADTADKIDAKILERDTRIYQHTVWRLLTAEVLPIDYREHVEALRAHLESLSGPASDFHLTPLMERVLILGSRCDDLYRGIAEGRIDSQSANRMITALSRVLVPIDYTLGDRFEHDPAISQPQVPALADIEKLSELRVDSDEYRFLHSRLTRARNRVAFALRQAVEALEQVTGGGDARA